MANDIRNILTISGNQKLIDEMLKAIQVDAFGRGSIDFKKVLPIPKDLDIPEGSDTREGIALVKDFLDKIPNEDLSREGTFDDFMEYFNQDLYIQEMRDYDEGRSKKRPNPEHRCQFCKDLNIKYYYPEFLRILFVNKDEPIVALVKKILDDDGFDDEAIEFLIDKYCTVKNANCIFCYIPNGYRDKKKDQNIYILKDGWEINRYTPKKYLIEQDNYNGLKYFVTISRSN